MDTKHGSFLGWSSGIVPSGVLTPLARDAPRYVFSRPVAAPTAVFHAQFLLGFGLPPVVARAVGIAADSRRKKLKCERNWRKKYGYVVQNYCTEVDTLWQDELPGKYPIYSDCLQNVEVPYQLLAWFNTLGVGKTPR